MGSSADSEVIVELLSKIVSALLSSRLLFLLPALCVLPFYPFVRERPMEETDSKGKHEQ